MAAIDKKTTVQMARGKVVTDAITGIGAILIKVPTAGRRISGGIAWFETPGFDDFVEVYITDEDNILGYGAGTIVAGYTDTGVPVANRGWYIAKTAPYIEIERLVEFGDLVGGLYLKIIGTKGTASIDTFRVNLHWGKPG